MGTNRYQVSDPDDVESNSENDRLEVDAVFRPGIDTSFSPKAFDNLEIGGSAENAILLDEKEDKENSLLTTPVSETTIRPPALLRSRPLRTRLKIFPDYA